MLSVMHKQSCCFAYKTYCFFDILIAVCIIGSLSRHLYPTNYCRIVGLIMFNLAADILMFDRNNGKDVVLDQEGAKQVDVATKDKVRGTPNPGLGSKVETPHSILQYPSMGSKIRK